MQSTAWLLAAIVLSVFALAVNYGVAHAATNLSVSPAAGSDAAKAIQAKLDEAHSKATVSNPYVITVAKGTYKLSTALHLYSNTTLNLTGVTLERSTANTNVIKVGENDDQATGYYYKNIAVVGGTLDGSNTGGTVVKFGHGKNLSLKSVTVKNVKDSHLMEAAGIDGLTVEGCTFANQKLSSTNPMPEPEALQLDILSQRHMKGYRSEDLPLKDVVVTKCRFMNVPRGVGSHTAVVNNPVDGVTITDNTFTNMTSGAIHGLNYINCVISGNKISKSPRGIVLYAMFEKGVHFGSSLGAEGNVKSSTPKAYRTPLANQNIVVTNNEVSVEGKDTYFGYEGDGIYLAGLTLTSNLKASADRDPLYKGDYYMSGAKVTSNIIVTASHGVRFRDVRNSEIARNTITYAGEKPTSDSRYGIQVTQLSKANTVTNNSIAGVPTNGIYVNQKSSAKLIADNKISSPGKYGISIEQSTVTKVSGNVISKSRNNGLHIFKGAKVSSVSKNTIKSSKAIGINVDQKSVVTKLASNVIKSPKQSGILVHNNATAKSIVSNRLSKCGDKGIGVYSTKAKVSITKNKVVKSKNYGIYIDTKTKKYKIVVKANKLTGSGKAAQVKIVSGKASVSGSKKAK